MAASKAPLFQFLCTTFADINQDTQSVDTITCIWCRGHFRGGKRLVYSSVALICLDRRGLTLTSPLYLVMIPRD